MHILDKDNNFSPTAFIPFCSFGDTLTFVGTELAQFDIPVCTIFNSKVHKDQLCYEADLEKYKDDKHVLNQLKMGLVLILDFNEDRWLKMPEEDKYFNISTEKDFINRTFERENIGPIVAILK